MKTLKQLSQEHYVLPVQYERFIKPTVEEWLTQKLNEIAECRTTTEHNPQTQLTPFTALMELLEELKNDS